MSENFTFSFSGDDIDEDNPSNENSTVAPSNERNDHTQEAPQKQESVNSAFPVSGKPLLPPTQHDIDDMLIVLPSKIAYDTLDIDLDGQGAVQLPRRELWDVRVQLMAEADDNDRDDDGGELQPGLGAHDVRTGVYEGGFKSWESSVDLVKELAKVQGQMSSSPTDEEATCIIELGCGTALPSLALFRWVMKSRTTWKSEAKHPITFILADYNPSVLQLVTLPNVILTWALQNAAESSLIADALISVPGELELTRESLNAFKAYLTEEKIALCFFSGAWSPELATLMQAARSPSVEQKTFVLGAETIYSPFALNSFTNIVFTLMEQTKGQNKHPTTVFAAAKKLYFGVGGSLDDFVSKVREQGAIVKQIREETDGIRRGVVRCQLQRGPGL